MKRFAIAAVLVVGLTGNSQAQDEKQWVDVYHSGNDRVGPMLLNDVKEVVSRSARFTLNSQGWAEISLLSVDSSSGAGKSAAVSVMFRTPLVCEDKEGKLKLEYRHTHQVMDVGRSKTETMAKELFADFVQFRDGQKCN